LTRLIQLEYRHSNRELEEIMKRPFIGPTSDPTLCPRCDTYCGDLQDISVECVRCGAYWNGIVWRASEGFY